MLELLEGRSLARRWREHKDSEAAGELVTSHLRLAAKIAKAYRGYGLPIGDLISEGNLELMQAVKRFEPERGFRLLHLREMVNSSIHSRIRFKVLVVGEDRLGLEHEEAVLQPPSRQEPPFGL